MKLLPRVSSRSLDKAGAKNNLGVAACNMRAVQ